jgi:hypothetical protein
MIAATPRAGNTLVQRLLAGSSCYEVVAAHSLGDIDLGQLGPCVLLQVHAGRSSQSIEFAARAGVTLVTIARNPLDVLLSMLHFCRNALQAFYWLDGQAFEYPGQLVGASPTSPAFVDWATGDRAARLLAVTVSWWNDPAVIRLRYEDVVGDTGTVMAGLARDLGLGCGLARDEARRIQATALRGFPNHHRWRAKPGGWRDLLPEATARTFHEAHRAVFDALGYGAPGPAVDRAAAEANWRRLKRRPAAWPPWNSEH